MIFGFPVILGFVQFIPLILYAVSVAATITSTAISHRANKEAGKQARYNAEYNADVEEKNAKAERAKRYAEERQERRQARARRAEIEAGFAASGLMMTGTPAYLLEEQAMADEANILQANSVSDQNFSSAMQRAGIIRKQGKFDQQAYNTEATTTLIKGVGSVSSQTASFGMAGGFGDNALFTGKGV